MSKIYLAAGCFWGVQYYFDQIPGVVSTKVGYTGGNVDNPTYEMVCTHTTGHAEAVEIEYDPVLIIEGQVRKLDENVEQQAYCLLLEHFFRMHNPTELNRQGPDVGDSYRSAIFVEYEWQNNAAQDIISRLNKSEFSGKIVTTIEKLGEFFIAENYHQKFTERTGQGMCHVGYQPL